MVARSLVCRVNKCVLAGAAASTNFVVATSSTTKQVCRCADLRVRVLSVERSYTLESRCRNWPNRQQLGEICNVVGINEDHTTTPPWAVVTARRLDPPSHREWTITLAGMPGAVRTGRSTCSDGCRVESAYQAPHLIREHSGLQPVHLQLTQIGEGDGLFYSCRLYTVLYS